MEAASGQRNSDFAALVDSNHNFGLFFIALRFVRDASVQHIGGAMPDFIVLQSKLKKIGILALACLFVSLSLSNQVFGQEATEATTAAVEENALYSFYKNLGLPTSLHS